MWGTMARNIRAAIQGVTEGFAKEMYMKGVGYKASVNGNKLVLVAGIRMTSLWKSRRV